MSLTSYDVVFVALSSVARCPNSDEEDTFYLKTFDGPIGEKRFNRNAEIS
jgi:hypothetical protein